MVDLSHSILEALVLHRVGNPARGESNLITDQLYPLNDDILPVLHRFLLKPFKGDQLLRFHAADQLSNNVVYSLAQKLFEGGEHQLLETSKALLEHLYQSSGLKNIKAGEFYVAYLKETIVGEEVTDAIGLFKSETRHTFLQYEDQEDRVEIVVQEGVLLDKLDKGCIIFNTDAEAGYLVKTVDQNSVDALYWKDRFLGVQPAANEMYYTEAVMNLCRSFANEVVASKADHKDEVLFLSKSMEYMNENEHFDLNDFAETVLEEPEEVEHFKSFKHQFDEAQHVTPVDQFEIAPATVKKMEQKIKNSIKLDTNLEIRFRFQSEVPLDRYLEKGFDEERQMSYYKVYFNKEV